MGVGGRDSALELEVAVSDQLHVFGPGNNGGEPQPGLGLGQGRGDEQSAAEGQWHMPQSRQAASCALSSGTSNNTIQNHGWLLPIRG